MTRPRGILRKARQNSTKSNKEPDLSVEHPRGTVNNLNLKTLKKPKLR
jgi:hypothetical protein